MICDACGREVRYSTSEEHVKSGDCELNTFLDDLAIEHPDYVCIAMVSRLGCGPLFNNVDSYDVDDTDPLHLMNIMRDLKLPNEEFAVSRDGYRYGDLQGMWAPRWIYDALVTFLATGYAGLTMEEYLRKVASEQPPV